MGSEYENFSVHSPPHQTYEGLTYFYEDGCIYYIFNNFSVCFTSVHRLICVEGGNVETFSSDLA